MLSCIPRSDPGATETHLRPNGDGVSTEAGMLRLLRRQRAGPVERLGCFQVMSLPHQPDGFVEHLALPLDLQTR